MEFNFRYLMEISRTPTTFLREPVIPHFAPVISGFHHQLTISWLGVK